MGRTIDLSGDSLKFVLYAFQLGAVVLALLFVVGPFGSSTDLLLALLFAVLILAMAVGLWRARTGEDGATHLGSLEDVTYDPYADPGQAAKDRWEKAVRRLHEGNDERK
ncbi:hypothetical protein [Halorientalis halophila]|uniref:hypothetical protein n=1 Tax=Halorientalis halophila TaxID=3108499 RepID=UPI00300BCCF4